MTLPDIDILVITYGRAGIERVSAMPLAPVQGVRYIVSWQKSEGIDVPDGLRRSDITVLRTPSVGPSANRNNALAHSTAEVVLFADDDVTLLPEGIQALRQAYAQNADAEVITFCANLPAKRYPDSVVRLGRRLPKGYYASGIELSARRAAVCNVRFCEELGPGCQRFASSEDEYFLYTCIRRGLRCYFVPVTVCLHPHRSTGTRRGMADGVLRSLGLLIALQYGPLQSPARIALKAWRLCHRGQANPLRAFFHMTAGALAYPKFRQP